MQSVLDLVSYYWKNPRSTEEGGGGKRSFIRERLPLWETNAGDAEAAAIAAEFVSRRR
jgi:hypothetical protein